jgi:hypothetical protein
MVHCTKELILRILHPPQYVCMCVCIYMYIDTHTHIYYHTKYQDHTQLVCTAIALPTSEVHVGVIFMLQQQIQSISNGMIFIKIFCIGSGGMFLFHYA